MAAPITHIILALQVLHLLPSNFNIKEFLIGTSFPDIRHIAHLKREQTHIEPISWHDVINAKSSFHAGMLFHNLVDITRIQHFETLFYNRLETDQFTKNYILLFPLAMKSIEDVILYDKANNWQEIITYFDSILPEEIALCTDQNILKKWHQTLQNYFRQLPSWQTIEKLLATIRGGDINEIQRTEYKKYFDTLLVNNEYKKQLDFFFNNFEMLLPSKPVTTPGL